MSVFPEKFTVGVIAPAGAVKGGNFDSGIGALQRLGARVKIFSHARGECLCRGYLAADDEARAADLSAAWLDEEVSMILCARGGYGCMRILDKLDWAALRRRDMPVAGFSDITALHWAMQAENAGRIVASPMLNYFADGLDEFSLRHFFSALDGNAENWKLPALRRGSICGRLLPGNLSVAAALAGSRYFPDCSGRIIVLEDVGEAPYRIDRMLTQLRLAGAFDDCAGVVFGTFTDCGNNDAVMEVLQDFASQVSCPVFYGLQFGHSLPMHSLSGDSAVTVTE